MQWMILPFKRYADFQGRSRRMEFWMFGVLNLIVGLVLAGPFYFSFVSAMLTMDPSVAGSDSAAADAMLSEIGTVSTMGLGLYGIYALAALIPNIAVTVRRLHDRDMSGWWYLGMIVASIIPLVGFIAILAFLVLMFLPGTDGPNRFGPDPKGRGEAQTFE